MTSPQHATAHQDHVRWQQESALWRDDLQEWRKEYDLALLALNNALTCHNNALGEHLKSIARHEANVLEAEQRIADFERPAGLVAGEDKCDHGDSHEEHAEQQELVRNAHERIKRHHYAAIAKVALLARTLGAEM